MASVGQLAAGVAHEINNPVGFVSSNLGCLQQAASDLLRLIGAYRDSHAVLANANPEKADQLEALCRDIDLEFLKEDLPSLLAESADGLARVTSIVHNLRTFAEPGGDTWSNERLDDIIDRALALLPRERRGDATILREGDGLAAMPLLAGELVRALLSLLDNACQALRAGGRITIRQGEWAEGQWLEVADDGEGIAAEQLSRVCEPFFTTRPVGSGAGLGLPLAFGIAERHGGRLEIESQPGQGTRVRVWLAGQPDRRG